MSYGFNVQHQGLYEGRDACLTNPARRGKTGLSPRLGGQGSGVLRNIYALDKVSLIGS